jgi:hypothetical protein
MDEHIISSGEYDCVESLADELSRMLYTMINNLREEQNEKQCPLYPSDFGE